MSEKELSSAQRKSLRGLAMRLKPAVLIGKAGLSANVVHELDAQLARHQLVKVRFAAGDKAAQKTMLEEIQSRIGAQVAGVVGNTAALFRENPNAEEKLI